MQAGTGEGDRCHCQKLHVTESIAAVVGRGSKISDQQRGGLSATGDETQETASNGLQRGVEGDSDSFARMDYGFAKTSTENKKHKTAIVLPVLERKGRPVHDF